jgi:hypothetical protein
VRRVGSLAGLCELAVDNEVVTPAVSVQTAFLVCLSYADKIIVKCL